MKRRAIPRISELVRGVFGLMYVGGAAVHLAFWASNREVYGELTQSILFDWYRGLWADIVLPNLSLLLPILAAFELALGVAILREDRSAKAGLGIGALFNLGLAPLGFWWPTNVALAAGHVALLRYEYPETSFGRIKKWLHGASRRDDAAESAGSGRQETD
jgi:hypothetical protein